VLRRDVARVSRVSKRAHAMAIQAPHKTPPPGMAGGDALLGRKAVEECLAADSDESKVVETLPVKHSPHESAHSMPPIVRAIRRDKTDEFFLLCDECEAWGALRCYSLHSGRPAQPGDKILRRGSLGHPCRTVH
jgi:hypothetical protein